MYHVGVLQLFHFEIISVILEQTEDRTLVKLTKLTLIVLYYVSQLTIQSNVMFLIRNNSIYEWSTPKTLVEQTQDDDYYDGYINVHVLYMTYF